MSEYCSVKTHFKDQDALVEALMMTGNWTREQIEVHQEPQPLIGFQGDVREQKAHVIIRRKDVQRYANDIGFERQADGSYQGHISEFDSGKFNEAWQKQLKQNYALRCMTKQAEAAGRRVTFERVGGRIMGKVMGYR